MSESWRLVDVNAEVERTMRELEAAGFELEDDDPDPWPAIPD